MPEYALVKIPTSPNWYIQWREAGRSRRATTGTPDATEAEGILAAFRLIQSDEPAADLTVAQALDWYWEDHGKKLMRPGNADLGIRKLRPFFGATLASECTL